MNRDMSWFKPSEKTPIATVSDMSRIPNHRPTRVFVDGVEVTRELTIHQLQIGKALSANMYSRKEDGDLFLKGMLGAANHDMIALGFEVISIDEVESSERPLEAVAAPDRIAALTINICVSLTAYLEGRRS